MLAGCPGEELDDDDDSAQGDDDDDDTGMDCDPLTAGAVDAWDGAAALEVGAVAELEGDDGSFSFHLEQTDADYLAVLISRSQETDTAWDLDVNGGATKGDSSPGAGDLIPVDPPAQGTAEPIGDPTVPEVGELRTFTLWSVYDYVDIEAEAILVTDEVVVYNDVDTQHTMDPLDPQFVEDIVAQFEAVVLPRERFFFHEESDVNEDGHISVLFSYTVNTYGAMAYVSSCDLVSIDDCDHSNEQELIYTSLPDPEDHSSSVNGLSELLAHEFAHNIYYASKFLDNDATDVDENVYVTEGTSALAQDLTGFNNGNLYVYGAALEDVWAGSVSDIFVYDGSHYYGDRDGPLRGLTYLLFRYMYDRYGAEVANDDGTFEMTCGVDFLHRWFTTATPGFAGVEEITGLDADTFIVDFWTALGAQQRVEEGTAADPAYHFQDPTVDVTTEAQRGVDFFMTVHGWYEIAGPATHPLDEPATVELRSGGATYFELNGLTEPADYTLATDGDADAVLRVIRVR